jgi:anaerobic ribonucleoside-triphosphate reductase activating protein
MLRQRIEMEYAKITSTEGCINLNRLHFPVSTLGYGQRVAIWMQGCSLQCPGCISHDTWAHGHGKVPFTTLTTSLASWLSQADGLTVSGGEPFEQPLALACLLRWWRQNHEGDILVFSGYSWEHLSSRYSQLLALIDVLISDPYQQDAGQTLPLRGSDNQRLHLLTPRASERYAVMSRQRALDICWDGDRLWMAGIPYPQDMAALQQRLHLQGLSFRSADQPVLEVLP